MTAQGFNELFQWLTLVGLLLLVLAAYRRLGLMFIDAKEFKLSQFGPAIGDRAIQLSDAMFGDVPDRVSRLAVFTREGCSICDDLMEHLRHWRDGANGSVAISVAAAGSRDYLDKIASMVPDARIQELDDIRRTLGSNPTSFPLSLLIDRSGRVVAKVLGADVDSLTSALAASSFEFPDAREKGDQI